MTTENRSIRTTNCHSVSLPNTMSTRTYPHLSSERLATGHRSQYTSSRENLGEVIASNTTFCWQPVSSRAVACVGLPHLGRIISMVTHNRNLKKKTQITSYWLKNLKSVRRKKKIENFHSKYLFCRPIWAIFYQLGAAALLAPPHPPTATLLLNASVPCYENAEKRT